MTNADNARQFSLDLSNLLKGATEDAVIQATRKLASDALFLVIKKSPVGNDEKWQRPAPKGYVGGQFRGAWQVSLGEGLFSGEASSVLVGLQPYQSVYVVNGLPYAERLENGWSQQAPLGMVALTVAELQSVILNYENGEVK